MADEDLKNENTSADEAGSVEGVETPEVDYKALYEKAEQERSNLAIVIGKQGQELGELRKVIQPTEKKDEINIDDYFDDDTKKVIKKIVDNEVKSALSADRESRDKQSLQKDFKTVYDEYDVTEENLTDLAYLASAKKISLSHAAEQLAKKGIIEKRNKTGGTLTKTTDGDGVPTGKPKVPSDTGISIDPVKMTTEQWNALSDEKRQELLAKVTAR